MFIKNILQKKRLKNTIVVFMSFVCFGQIVAQNTPSSCSQSLKEAQKAYEKGNIELIKSKIENCVSSTEFSKIEQMQAYRLMILSFLYLDDQKNAEKWMNDLLVFEPDYKPNKLLDPIEYIKLYESFNVIPWISAGLSIGVNASRARNVWDYNVGNSDGNNTTKNSTGFSINLGGVADFNLKKKLFLTTEVQLVTRALKAEKAAFSNSKITVLESQTLLEVPLSLKYIIGDGKLKPYIRVGGGINLNLSSSQSLNRIKDDENATVEYSGPAVDVKSSRNAINTFALVGAGLMFKIGYGHLFIDARYQYGLSNLVKQAGRYETVNSRLTSYGYIEDDFAINSVFINTGYIYSFYKVKKVRKKIVSE
ncbi:MAG: PorT family protein [Bacteroidetes bacterium]|nr:MAG: PorT family protein [Bacteroidota bacterium]